MHCLPLTADAFRMYRLWVLHQLVVWKQAHLSQPPYPAATDFGRHLTNGKLVATMMLKNPKPCEIKHTKYCHCKESKCVRGCSCARANVNCTGDPDKCSRVELVVDCSDSDWLRNMSTMNMLARYIILHCAMRCSGVHKTNFQHACCLTWSSTTILPLFVLVILFYLVLKFCS